MTTRRRVYAIAIAREAMTTLAKIRDKKLRAELGAAIDGLARSPDTQGKPLGASLAGLRSVRAARERYRILYRVSEETVQIVFLGPRRPGSAVDVYALAERLAVLLSRT